jgi:DNA-binding response OmpR family regulator
MIAQGTILVAEDDLAIVALLIEVLTDEGYLVQIAASGSDALAALLADRLDLALIDLSLPGMDGRELLSAARAQPIDVPIVMMSTSTLATSELTAAGAQAGLSKPFELDQLLACVAQHIRRGER